jgi:hypothetical protein
MTFYIDMFWTAAVLSSAFIVAMLFLIWGE